MGYLHLIQKDFITHIHGLTVYVKEGLPFAQDLTLENSRILTYVFDWLDFTHCHPSFSCIDHLCLYAVFSSISSNIDEVLSINPSTNVFFFGDFNICHKDQLTYSGGTDKPDELCYNFFTSNDLTQMVEFPTWILDCDSHSPARLDLFLIILEMFHWKISLNSVLLLLLLNFVSSDWN